MKIKCMRNNTRIFFELKLLENEIVVESNSLLSINFIVMKIFEFALKKKLAKSFMK